MHLGIQPGTVKIHLKHIFEKTGVRGRYGLALNGLRRSSGTSSMGPVPVGSTIGVSNGAAAGAALSSTA